MGTEFRGKQEAVIRAIMGGERPIVQITGTGDGKSLIYIGGILIPGRSEDCCGGVGGIAG